MNPKVLAALRDSLAKLYPDERSIHRIVDDSGIDSSKMTIDIHAENSWHSILSEAEKHYQVEALLQAVEHEYGNNREFQAACQAYRRSQDEQEDAKQHANIPIHQLKPHTTWQQRLPSVLMGILLIGFAGGGAYWVWKGLPSGGIITPTATAAISASGASEEKSTELSTVTVAAVSPSPTSIATVATATTASIPTATVPQPTDTPPEVASALCSFAFLVLDEQSEEPIRRATIAVFIGVRQGTGTTDSTGYYLAKLPCSNEQAVEARVRVSVDNYIPYNRSVFLNDETTEILLESKTTPTPSVTPTATFTLIPTLQPAATVTLTPTPGYPCLAEIKSEFGLETVQNIYKDPEINPNKRKPALPVGKTVEIRKVFKENVVLYNIWSVEGTKLELGWIALADLNPSPTCPPEDSR